MQDLTAVPPVAGHTECALTFGAFAVQKLDQNRLAAPACILALHPSVILID